MFPQAAAPHGKVAPDSLPDGSLTDPVLARLLLSRFPADRIVQRIHDMIEATRRTSFDTYESDWRTVESGIRLYLEFTARHPALCPAGPASPPVACPPDRPIPSIPAAPNLTAASPAGPPDSKSSILIKMSRPPKDVYAHRLETLDEMRRLMIAEGPLTGGTVGLTLPGAGSLPVRSVTTSLVPKVVHPPRIEMPESANRLRWWALASCVAIAGLVVCLWLVAPQLSTRRAQQALPGHCTPRHPRQPSPPGRPCSHPHPHPLRRPRPGPGHRHPHHPPDGLTRPLTKRGIPNLT